MAFLRVFVAQWLGEPGDVKSHLHTFCVPAEARSTRQVSKNFLLIKPIAFIDLCAHVVGKGPRVHVFIAREG